LLELGVGVPGIVDKQGNVLLFPNLGWKDIELKNELAKEYKLPDLIENEANAGAHGEKQFGAGHKFNVIIYVNVGIGIGVVTVLIILLVA
jgi:predicted NBD/HSP70 family sugar kinase